jgi:glycosyltransferase involved in cell wall biosynthesis
MPRSDKSPVKILMTADTIGGVFQYSQELARGLAERGTEVFIATMGAPLRRSQRELLDAIGPKVRVIESRYALEWMREPWSDVDRAERWLLGLARELRPDLVHLNAYSHGSADFQCPVVVVGHSCVLSWWKAVHKEDAPPFYDAYRARVCRGLSGASAVVAPSEAMANSLREHYGVERPIAVIHNGRNASEYAPGRKLAYVLSLGRVWDEAKNMMALDEVASGLPWPIRIAGPTDHDRAVQFRNADYLGSLDVSLLTILLARAAIYALPARYEPFGLSVLEAALSGCALVLGDIPSLRELWDDAALYVDADDRNGLTEQLQRLMRDDDLRRDMAERARARALRYSANRMVSEYVQLYRRLVDCESAPQIDNGAACA